LHRLNIFLGNHKGSDHLGDTGIDGKVIIKFILKIWGLEMWTGFIWLRIISSDGW
jgi:hypothetical protein